MGLRSGYTPGTFCWTDLGTTDPEAAKAFYLPLFGWEAEDVPAGEGTYTLLRLEDKTVAALFRNDDMPHPAWISYVSVEDADAAAGRAGELGATTLQAPFDVMEIGRMAVLQDPTGAVFALWQPRSVHGAELVNDPGALCLNQLNTSDVEAAKSFYAELFGWRIEDVSGGEGRYWGIHNGEALNGGLMPLPPGAQAPPHWLVYFTSTDLRASAERVGELGGAVLVEPMEVPGGEIMVARDPQGAVFGLFAGRVDP